MTCRGVVISICILVSGAVAAAAEEGPLRGAEFQRRPDGAPGPQHFERDELGPRRLSPVELLRLVEVDGDRVFLQGTGATRPAGMLLEMKAHVLTRITWVRTASAGPGVSFWDGNAWRKLPEGEFKSRYADAGISKELAVSLRHPPGKKSFWIWVDSGTRTDALTTREAAPDEKTAERLREHGPEEVGLVLALWKGTESLCLLADNRRKRTLRKPLSSGRLILSARRGDHSEEAEVAMPEGLCGADIPAAGAGSKAPIARFRLIDLPLDPEEAGLHEIRFRFVRSGPPRGMDSAHWTGSVESNPVEMNIEGWLPARKADGLAEGEERVELPPGDGGWPKPDTYRAGPFSFDFLAGALGTRSERVMGILHYDGRPVIPEKVGDRIRTPFGTLTFAGRLPLRRGLLGWLSRPSRWGESGWLPTRE